MTPPPTIPGYNITWSDDFSNQGSPNPEKWSLETPATNNNGEQQKYTNSTENAYVDRGQMYIVPVKKDNIWTSARMHGDVDFQCDPGKKAIIAARIKVGQNSPAQQQGIWPAFWTLGSSVGQIGWPRCCEWDILELGNGNSWSQGTCHQQVNGQHYQTDQKVDFNHAQYHTWAVEVDLTSDDYMQQKLSWQLDGRTFFEVKCMGQDAESRACWERCARSAFYPILNVAVGGNFIGAVGPEMIGGVESGLTVAWVAIYKSTA